ncbi:MAG: ABC transporter substrate-binding protein, partial [Acidimicrobiia bacterium]
GAEAPSGGSQGTEDDTAEAEALEEIVVASAALPTSFAPDGGGAGVLENITWRRNGGAGLVRNVYVPEDDGSFDQDSYEYEGYLAESWDVSEDGKVYTFHLREGVMSVNGNEFDADDVLWSYERKFNTATSIVKSISFPIITDLSQIQKVDKYTVSFTLEQPGHGFTLLGLLGQGMANMYDSDYLKANATPADPYAVEFSKTNANYGYGPYVVESFTPGQEMVWRSNPDHALGEPAIKKITFRVVTDPASRANALRTGDVDVAEVLRPADQVDLSGSGAAKSFTFETNAYALATLVSTHPPFDDVDVRRAFTYAVPYQQIIDDVYRGRALPAVGFLNPRAPGYTDDGLPRYEYDPDKAKEMLEEAGHPDGVSFTLTVSNALSDIQEVAVAIQSYAKDAGFDIEIQELPGAAFTEGVNNKTFDATLNRSASVTLSPAYELNLYFRAGSTTNGSGWESQEYYDAMAVGTSLPDPLSDEAGEAWNAVQKIYMDEVPMIFMARIQPLNAFANNVDGYANRSDNVIDFSMLTATVAD